MSKKKVSVVYAGRRLHGEGQVVHYFYQGKAEYRFAKTRGCRIGRSYLMNVDGKRITMDIRPDWNHRSTFEPAEETCKQWEAADELVAAHLAKQKARRNAERHSKLGALADHIRPFVEGMNFFEQRAFLEALFNKVSSRNVRKRSPRAIRK